MQKTDRAPLKVIGHRGAKGLAPENTLASFAKALEYGVDEIEFDARVTKDNVVVLVHDPWIRDVAGTILLIRQHTYANLLLHKTDLITLNEAMAWIGNKVPITIDVKPGQPVEPVVAILSDELKNGLPAEQLSVGSFSQKTLRELHTALPDIDKVVIERWSSLKAIWRARQVNARRLNMRSWWLWSGVIRSLSKRGYLLTPYTMNNPDRARRWHKYGMQGVITDFPDRYV